MMPILSGCNQHSLGKSWRTLDERDSELLSISASKTLSAMTVVVAFDSNTYERHLVGYLMVLSYPV